MASIQGFLESNGSVDSGPNQDNSLKDKWLWYNFGIGGFNIQDLTPNTLIAQHREFRKKTVDFCTATMLGVSKVPEALLDYLHDWLLEHLLNHDKAYKSFFHERGVE